MPLRFVVEEDSKADAGTWVPWKKDPDTGKLIRFRLRVIPKGFTQAQRARFNRGIKSENLGKRLATDIQEKQLDITRARALYALLDSENFEIIVGGPAAAQRFAELLGRAIEPEQVLTVDGLWPQIGEYVLAEYEELAAWINNRSEELRGIEVEEEEELLKT